MESEVPRLGVRSTQRHCLFRVGIRQQFVLDYLNKMGLRDLENIELAATFDAHVHLRDESMMETVVPTIRNGAVNMVFVMVGSRLL